MFPWLPGLALRLMMKAVPWRCSSCSYPGARAFMASRRRRCPAPSLWFSFRGEKTGEGEEEKGVAAAERERGEVVEI